MEIYRWLNSSLPSLVGRLAHNINSTYHIASEENLSLSGRTAIFETLETLLSVLFPGAYSKERVESSDLLFFLDDSLRHASHSLLSQVHQVLQFYCADRCCNSCSCEERSHKAVIDLLESLPELRTTLLEDIKAAYEGDPEIGRASCRERV